ncbi:G protein-coupled glucose receptor regulating Gpa2-domain-containing protein [Lasiosphaeris hirsuta]|uniref:G protein-coupled glucose receptor regulating Gpa2-domain-containing protein n=1 Tax=Lasiosphaeris hirsuta TaxID=260670 RepID=A0AA40AG21_9PEZI|nr:G protein-coupled glucose receptor regulating Gpa2-domain-containing protein [Lasiosphaeris hirsuta]
MTGSLPPPVVARDGADGGRMQHEVYVLAILSLTFASISVVSTLSTLYWFVKMRRGFRHELIMLLIQSDFVKSAAFVVFPIVSLLRGTVASDSAFCQASGFALAVGIESSDIAVLLIALHSVMYIFRPRSGLYPYRRIAYLVYYVFPVIIASLAFINGSGYENVGHYCYLRTDGGWRRLALSWIPRYIIGIGIVVIYAFIYIYIRRRMDDYGRRSSGNFPERRSQLWYEVPPTPRIKYHGLLSSAPNSRRGSAAESIAKDRQRSVSSISSFGLGNSHATGPKPLNKTPTPSKQSMQWNWSGFKQPRRSSGETSLFPDETEDPLTPNAAPVSAPLPVHSAQVAHETVSEDPSESSTAGAQSFWRRPLGSSLPTPGTPGPGATDDHLSVQRQNVSLPNIITMLRKGPPNDRRRATAPAPDHFSWRHHLGLQQVSTTETSPILNSPGTLVWEDEFSVSKNREKIRRQLRSLFVYPLVYMFVWLFPFVSHVMGYDDAVRSGDPFWLLVVGIISLCVQGAVDCALFTLRERPWRHEAAGAAGGFWGALGKRLAVNWDGSWRDVGMAGRTREEMMVDGRLARQRREEEIAFERAMRASFGQSGLQLPPKKVVREWWDIEVDGTWDDSEWEDEDRREARQEV